MLSLLVDKGWICNHRVVEPLDMKSPRLMMYCAAIATAVLLIVAGIVLASTAFDATPQPPPIIKERIRLM